MRLWWKVKEVRRESEAQRRVWQGWRSWAGRLRVEGHKRHPGIARWDSLEVPVGVAGRTWIREIVEGRSKGHWRRRQQQQQQRRQQKT
jgi:hypothetical protein